MKKILTILFSIILVSSCTTRDEDTYYQKTINLSANNYIKVYTQSNYNVGDKLYLESIFSKLQDEPGYPNKLDIFKTTNSRQFAFNFSLEKKVFNGNWTQINLNSSDFEVGGLGTIYSSAAICELNQTNTQYEFYKGIILHEAGEYRLTIYPYIDNLQQNYNTENINVIIETTIENLTSNSYEFIVN